MKTSFDTDDQMDEIAYTLDLVNGGKLHIKKSANAWWMDQAKMHKLLAAFAIQTTLHETCLYVGISQKQYKYFASLHSEIYEIRKIYSANVTLMARKNIAKAVQDGDIKTSKWIISKKSNESDVDTEELKTRPEDESEDMKLAKQFGMEAFNEEMRKILTRKKN